jgi:hypothetical protein
MVLTVGFSCIPFPVVARIEQRILSGNTHFNVRHLLITITVLLSACITLRAQSRFIVHTGGTLSAGGGFNQVFASERGHVMAEAEWDKKILGPIHSSVGLSYIRTGYFTEENAFGSMSRFRGNYIALPLLARYNITNKNYLYLDLGLNPFFLVNATLEEGITEFGQFRSVKADITKYSGRLFMGYRFQFTAAFNRFSISEFIIWQGKNQSAIKGLQDHWAFNQEQSSYLQGNGFSNFWMGGFKLGIRIY